MSISLGNLNITGISLGTTTFAEAYLGTVKIFDRSVSVPSNLIFRSDPASINENSLVLLPDNILYRGPQPMRQRRGCITRIRELYWVLEVQ